jgi:hypothetical protein
MARQAAPPPPSLTTARARHTPLTSCTKASSSMRRRNSAGGPARAPTRSARLRSLGNSRRAAAVTMHHRWPSLSKSKSSACTRAQTLARQWRHTRRAAAHSRAPMARPSSCRVWFWRLVLFGVFGFVWWGTPGFGACTHTRSRTHSSERVCPRLPSPHLNELCRGRCPLRGVVHCPILLPDGRALEAGAPKHKKMLVVLPC